MKKEHEKHEKHESMGKKKESGGMAKTKGFSGSLGRSHKEFGKKMSPAGK
jgi:hypothetical protein